MAAVVDPGAFRRWMEPKVAAMRKLSAAIEEVRQRYPGGATVNSRAMGDIADQERYLGRSSWEQPITDARTFGEMTLRAANDYTRAFAELFDSTQPPIYAHLAVARSALESAVVSWWLSDPRISSLDRVKRGLCELLYSAIEVRDLARADKTGQFDLAASEASVAEWKAVADHFKWAVNLKPSRPIVDGTKRPSVSAGIVALARSDADSPIGNMLFSRLSAVSHVTWFGLQSAIDLIGAIPNRRSGTATVPIGTDGAQVSAIAFYVVRVLRNAADSRFTYMGWNDLEWQAAVREALALEEILAQTVLRARKGE